jgi:hypothetical protein
MSLESVFLICNFAVMPAWLLLLVAPGWVWTQRLVHSLLIPILLGTAYLLGFLTAPPGPEGASFGSLEGVTLFFSAPHGVLVGWIHYLVFDLFVGAWQVRDARRRGLHHGFVVPCLLFTLILGPIGLLLYLVIRFAVTRETTLEESSLPT